MPKVLLLNGSPHAKGCTATALEEMIGVFEQEGIETELIQVGNQSIRGCIACGSCARTGKCVFNDLVNETAAKLKAADGLVVGSPVYFSSPNGSILSFLDRLFYSARLFGGGCQERSRGAADHAQSGAQHGIPDPGHCGRKGEIRSSEDGAVVVYQLPGREIKRFCTISGLFPKLYERAAQLQRETDAAQRN